MIVIKDQDFEMEQVKTTPFFNLKMAAIINKGKANERTEMKILGHSLPFVSAIINVVAIKLAAIDETYTIKQYVAAYKKEIQKIVPAEYINDKEYIEDTSEVDDVIEED